MRFPTTSPPFSGTCMCGKVIYELTSWPLTFYACHCTDCQRRTGGAMRLAMWVDRTALRVIEGEPELQTFELGGGRQRRAMVCADCDTRLWAEPADRPAIAILFPGTLHSHGDFEPVAHLWTRSAPSWVVIPPNSKQYDTQPEDKGELVRLWRDELHNHMGEDAFGELVSPLQSHHSQ